MIIEAKNQNYKNDDTYSVFSNLLASEDVKFVRNSRTETAYFDIVKRQIVLPSYDIANSKVINTMFIAHEVGHALFTKYSVKDFKKYSEKFQQLFNLVEDAYIERQIKKVYRGLIPVFKTAIQELYEKEFLGKKEYITNDKLNFIDKLNLKAKGQELFSFLTFDNKEEEGLYVRLIQLNSNEEVIKLCEDILEYLKKNNMLNQNKQNQEQHGTDSENSENSSQDGSSNSQNSKGKENKNSSNSQKSDNNSEENSESQNGEQENGKNKSEDDSNGNGQNGNEQDEENDENNQNGANDNDSDENGNNKSNSSDDDGQDQNSDGNNNQLKNISKTMNNLAKKLKQDHKTYAKQAVSTIDIFSKDNTEKKLVVDFITESPRTLGIGINLPNFTEYRNKVYGTVNEAVALFNTKKNAKNYQRIQHKKTGSLDIRKLHKYSISENIFKNIEVIKEQKNHMQFIFIDFSGSMQNNIDDVIFQASVSAEFCKRAGIEFEIYGFGLSVNSSNKECAKICDSKTYKLEHLYAMTRKIQNTVIRERYHMNCTPLNDIFFVVDKLYKMNTVNKKISIIILTDGEPNTANIESTYNRFGGNVSSNNFDVVINCNRFHYDRDDHVEISILKAMIEYLRKNFDINVILYLVADYNINNNLIKLFDKTMDQNKKLKEIEEKSNNSFELRSEFFNLVRCQQGIFGLVEDSVLSQTNTKVAKTFVISLAETII